MVVVERGLSWSSSMTGGSQAFNHLVRKQTLNHLAKLAVWLNDWLFVYELRCCGFDFRCCYLNFRYRTCFEQVVLDIQANTECRFTLRCVPDMIVTYNLRQCCQFELKVNQSHLKVAEEEETLDPPQKLSSLCFMSASLNLKFGFSLLYFNLSWKIFQWDLLSNNS